MRSATFVRWGAVLLLLSGCNIPVDQGAAEYGLKAGSKLGGILIVRSGAKTTQSFVTSSLSFENMTRGAPAVVRLPLTAVGVAAPLSFVGTWNGRTLSVEFDRQPVQVLYWNSRSQCFENDEADLCLSDTDAGGVELQYHTQSTAGEVSLTLDAADAGSGVQLEAPKTYRFEELVELGKNRSFASQVQFTAAQQSRDLALSSRLNLLPHVGIGDFMTVATAGINTTGLLRSIGNLAPFLFPSRWFKASELRAQSRVDQDSYYLMQADSANIVEGLAYSLIRDQKVFAIYQQYEKSLQSLAQLLQDREQLGAVPVGSAANILTVLNGLKQIQLNLSSAIANDKIGLSRATGFMNPDAVADVIAPEEAPVVVPGLAGSGDLQSMVIHRSMELKQYDDLLDAAHANVKATIFSVLDPSGGAFLGFGLKPQIRASRDQVNQVLVQRTNEQSALLASLQMALNSIRTSAQSYEIAQQSLQLQKNRIRLMSDQMSLGLSVSVTDLQDAFQNVLTQEANSLTARYSFYIAQSTLNRLLYLGAYSGLGRQ